jgi:DUF4097 and DUF4098 domain-containing protein YvlB
MRARCTNSDNGPAAVTGRGYAVLAVLQTLGLLFLLGAAPDALADSDTVSVSESRPASPDGRVSVEMISGTLDVSGWNEDRVEVTGTLDRRFTLNVETAGDLVTVKVELPMKKHLHLHDAVCDLRVRIPSHGSITIQVVSAEAKIAGVSGAVEVESVSGGVNISGESKRVRAQVVSGDLDITGVGGRISAEAVSGNVSVESTGGEVEGTTVSGRVTVHGGPFERVTMEAVSGDTEFEGALTPDAEVDISNHSGTVDFALKGAEAGEFDVSTFSGDIHSDFGGSSHRTSKYAPGEEYHYTMGSGGPRISIEAFSGRVRLRKL